MNLTALDLELDTGLPEKALRLPDILSSALSLYIQFDILQKSSRKSLSTYRWIYLLASAVVSAKETTGKY